MKRRRRRSIGITAIGLLAALGVAAPSAATTSPSVTVTGGALTLTALTTRSVSFASTDTIEPLPPFSVTDARGTGAGWRLVIQASPLQEWDGTTYVDGGRTLAAGSLTLTGLRVAGEATGSAPPNMSGDGVAIDASAVTVAAADADTGMGRYRFGEGVLHVAVPADAQEGSYRSELSLSVTSGP